MKLRTLIATSLLAALAALAVPAFAHDSTPRVDQRQVHQQGRIQHGVASGALTGREAQRLQHEQHAIHRAERHAKADGVVTHQEREQLQHMQRRASRHIAHDMHDRQTRHGQTPHGQTRGLPDRW